MGCRITVDLVLCPADAGAGCEVTVQNGDPSLLQFWAKQRCFLHFTLKLCSQEGPSVIRLHKQPSPSSRRGHHSPSLAEVSPSYSLWL